MKERKITELLWMLGIGYVDDVKASFCLSIAQSEQLIGSMKMKMVLFIVNKKRIFD